MRITVELLQKHGSCEKGIKYIEQNFPNGIEMIDIIQHPNVEVEFLHWGREHLGYSPEELAAYEKACNVINSNNYWYSSNLYNSNFIVKSDDIKNSNRIFYSNDIEASNDIVSCETITSSNQIFISSIVDNCSHIFHSINIGNSKNVLFSQMISRSKNIHGSKNIFTSSEIIKSERVTDSYFCQNCKNIKHCMFCENLEDAEYYIFNQPVDKERFEFLVEQYKRFMQYDLNFVSFWPEDLIKAYSPAVIVKFNEWYKTISTKFWKWVRTIPNFDSMLLYNITMNPEILVDK